MIFKLDKMKVTCNNCGRIANLDKEVTYFTCLSCYSTLKLVKTSSFAYTELVLEQASENLVLKQDKKVDIYEKIKLLDSAWINEKDNLGIKGISSSNDEKIVYFHSGVLLFFAVAWTIGCTVMGILDGAWGVLPLSLFGVFFVIILIWNLSNFGEKLKKFKKAEAQYNRKRKALEVELN